MKKPWAKEVDNKELKGMQETSIDITPIFYKAGMWSFRILAIITLIMFIYNSLIGDVLHTITAGIFTFMYLQFVFKAWEIPSTGVFFYYKKGIK